MYAEDEGHAEHEWYWKMTPTPSQPSEYAIEAHRQQHSHARRGHSSRWIRSSPVIKGSRSDAGAWPWSRVE